MFVNFNDVFNDKPQSQVEVPKAMLEYLNEQLPHGLEYISSSDGRCIIKSDSKELTLGGIKFNPTKEQKKILGENYTQKDVLDYSYNSQEKIPLLPGIYIFLYFAFRSRFSHATLIQTSFSFSQNMV